MADYDTAIAWICLSIVALLGLVWALSSLGYYPTNYYTIDIYVVNVLVAITLNVIVSVFIPAVVDLTDTIWGRTMCYVYVWASLTLRYVSIFLIAVLAVERILVIRAPTSDVSRSSRVRVKLIVSLLWLLAAVIGAGPLLGWAEVVVYMSEDQICNTMAWQINRAFGVTVVVIVLALFVLSIACLVDAFCHLRYANKRIKSDVMTLPREIPTTVASHMKTCYGGCKVACIVVLVCFLVNHLPYTIIAMIGILVPDSFSMSALESAVLWLILLEALLLPNLLCLLSSRYRNAYIRTLVGCCCCDDQFCGSELDDEQFYDAYRERDHAALKRRFEEGLALNSTDYAKWARYGGPSYYDKVTYSENGTRLSQLPRRPLIFHPAEHPEFFALPNRSSSEPNLLERSRRFKDQWQTNDIRLDRSSSLDSHLSERTRVRIEESLAKEAEQIRREILQSRGGGRERVLQNPSRNKKKFTETSKATDIPYSSKRPSSGSQTQQLESRLAGIGGFARRRKSKERAKSRQATSTSSSTSSSVNTSVEFEDWKKRRRKQRKDPAEVHSPAVRGNDNPSFEPSPHPKRKKSVSFSKSKEIKTVKRRVSSSSTDTSTQALEGVARVSKKLHDYAKDRRRPGSSSSNRISEIETQNPLFADNNSSTESKAGAQTNGPKRMDKALDEANKQDEYVNFENSQLKEKLSSSSSMASFNPATPPDRQPSPLTSFFQRKSPSPFPVNSKTTSSKSSSEEEPVKRITIPKKEPFRSPERQNRREISVVDVTDSDDFVLSPFARTGSSSAINTSSTSLISARNNRSESPSPPPFPPRSQQFGSDRPQSPIPPSPPPPLPPLPPPLPFPGQHSVGQSLQEFSDEFFRNDFHMEIEPNPRAKLPLHVSSGNEVTFQMTGDTLAVRPTSPTSQQKQHTSTSNRTSVLNYPQPGSKYLLEDERPIELPKAAGVIRLPDSLQLKSLRDLRKID